MQDKLIQFEELAIGSRLKRLSDRLMKGTTKIYKRLRIDFDPYHMPIFKLVSEQDELSISEISNLLNVTQPAVTQYINSLIKNRLVNSKIGKTDKRKRKISLTIEGEKMLKTLQPVWIIIDKEIKGLTHDPVNKTLLEHVTFIESKLKEKSFSNRILEKVNLDNYGK